MMRSRLVYLLTILVFVSSPDAVRADDSDGDGVPDDVDVCCVTLPGAQVDAEGRPLGDFDGDCDVDLSDFGIFQANLTGPLGCVPEICDGLDNDCNCVIDDMGVLTCGVGECHREVPACVGGVPQTCVPGVPLPENCADGLDNDCDGVADCADTASCPNGSLCGVANEVCAAGLCDCDTGYGDCDGNKQTNGCETDLWNNAQHCGACDSPCPGAPNATAACSEGVCGLVCDTGWGNCNGNAADGCETNLLTSMQHCGVCGNACNLVNAFETCLGGQCVVAACETGWCNQDGIDSNGCEYDLDVNPSCGSFTNLGTIRGDVGSDLTSNNAKGERWFRVYVAEDDTSSFTCVDLSATVTLTPPSGTDYDLRVYCDDCTTVAGSSAQGGSAVDTVHVRWDEECMFGVPSGTDSGRYVYILVEHYAANVCNNYALQVRGNTATGSNTCSTK